MWAHQMTDDQKREYGFVKLSHKELNLIGHKRLKRFDPIFKFCESCGSGNNTVLLDILSTKNATPDRSAALLCKECRTNNRLGRRIIKGWLH